MAGVQATTRIAAPVDRVFEVFTDLRHADERIPEITAIEVLTDGPIGSGTRWRETRIMFKRECTEEMGITDFERPSRYAVESDSCGVYYRTVFTFRADGDQTEVTVNLSARPHKLSAWLMTPLALMMKGMLRKCLTNDMNSLRTYIEGGPVAVPASAS